MKEAGSVSHEKSVQVVDIEGFIQQSSVVDNVLSIADLKDQIIESSSIEIMMGQTFDDGQPVDMLKYGLFMMNLSDLIKNNSRQVKLNWLLADHFITDINQDAEVQTIKLLRNKRVQFLQKMNSVYGGNIDIIFSSELCQRTDYQHNLDRLIKEAEENTDFMKMVLRAVPQDRRGNPNTIRYPLEELATIQTIGANIKIGPPYEMFYDKPAREIAETIGFTKYTAIHLKKSYPFGYSEADQLPKEVEEFGILPYKLNSKGLRGFRLDVFGDIREAQNLIYSTIDTRPLIDLINITTMARFRLEGSGDILSVRMSELDQLRKLAFESYRTYIHGPMNSGF